MLPIHVHIDIHTVVLHSENIRFTDIGCGYRDVTRFKKIKNEIKSSRVERGGLEFDQSNVKGSSLTNQM